MVLELKSVNAYPRLFKKIGSHDKKVLPIIDLERNWFQDHLRVTTLGPMDDRQLYHYKK